MANNQLANHGGWNQGDALNDNYLVGAPMEMIRHQAGYQPKLFSSNTIPTLRRGLVEPPGDLQRLVFPFVEEVRNYMQASPDSFPLDKTVDLRGFLEACDYAAIIFLQDAAVLQDSMSMNRIYSHPLFQTELFMDFQQELRFQMEAFQENLTGQELTDEEKWQAATCLRLVEKLSGLLYQMGGRIMENQMGGKIIECSIVDEELKEVINRTSRYFSFPGM